MHLLGLKPWDLDRLTIWQFESYTQWIDQWLELQKKKLEAGIG